MRSVWWGILPLLAAVAVVESGWSPGGSPWWHVWVLAAALFFGLKLLVVWDFREAFAHQPARRRLGYGLGWVGMDPEAFLSASRGTPGRPGASWDALLTATGGAGLLAVVAPLAETMPTLVSWLALLGLGLVLHFGVFKVLAAAWRWAGVPVEPIMRAPLAARGLADFWGERWNRAFRFLGHRYVFRPLRRRIGPTLGMMAVFGASGLIHDLVLSVPVRAGYGLPTAYFLIQGLGVIAERLPWLGSGSGWLRRLWAVMVLTLPLPLLFHAPFREGAVLPWLGSLAGLAVAWRGEQLIALAGWLQLAIAASSLGVPHVLQWRRRLAPIDRFHRRLFWVYAGFILLVNVSFGFLSLVYPDVLAEGRGLAGGVALVIALYWLARLVVQVVLFGTEPPVSGWAAGLAYRALTAAFAVLATVYGAAVAGWL